MTDFHDALIRMQKKEMEIFFMDKQLDEEFTNKDFANAHLSHLSPLYRAIKDNISNIAAARKQLTILAQEDLNRYKSNNGEI